MSLLYPLQVILIFIKEKHVSENKNKNTNIYDTNFISYHNTIFKIRSWYVNIHFN